MGLPRGDRTVVGLDLENRCPFGVKSGKAQTEQMFSGLCLRADATRLWLDRFSVFDFFFWPSRTKSTSLRPLVEQRLRLLQIKRVESFSEPAVDRSDQFARLLRLALFAPKPSHAHC